MTYLSGLPASPSEFEGMLESFLDGMHSLDFLPVETPSPTASRPAKRSLSETERDDEVPVALYKKKRSKPTWFRRKNELQALRGQSEALETRILYLQMKRGDNLSSQRARTGALVERQRHEDAPEENRRLRDKLESYARQAKALQNLFRNQHSIIPVPSATDLPAEVKMKSGRFSSPVVLNLLQTRVDERYRELDEAFALMKQPMACIDTNMVETSNVSAVEFARTQLLPFSNTAIFSALWSVIEMGEFPDGEDAVVKQSSDDVYAMDSHVTVHLESGASIDIHSCSVMKRFITADGVAILTETSSDWMADHPVTGKWCHTTREGGCHAMRNYSVECGRVPRGICQSRSMQRLTKAGQDRDCAAITEVVIPSFRELVNSRHQFMENALFDIIRRMPSM